MGAKEPANSPLSSKCNGKNDATGFNHHGSYGSIADHDCKRSPGSPSLSNGSYESVKEEPITHTSLLRKNSNYRYFLLSYVINKIGEWLTYLASISMIQEITKRDDANQSNANTLISILLLVKLLPNVVLMPIGGILADSFDRRNIQVILDLYSSCVVVVFLWSIYSDSIALCLLANFLIETASGLYVPSNQAMLPQLFGEAGKNGEGEELKKATVLYGMSWSLMAAIGSSLGGVLVAMFGTKGCFIIDSITYLASAIILRFGVQGDFNASTPQATMIEGQSEDSVKVAQSSVSPSSSLSTSTNEHENLSLLEEQIGITQESSSKNDNFDHEDSGAIGGGLHLFVKGLKFLFFQEPLVGACALLKGSAALSFGAVDVLNVSFSTRGSELDPSKTSLKLGFLFGCVGVGCILGSVITDAISNLSFPRRIARLCLGGFSCMFVALFWMAATPDIFLSLCASTVIRSIGSSVVWINSTLLIQKFTPQALLGRVSSFDSGVALLAEGISAMGCGLLMDQKGFAAEELSFIIGCIAVFFFLFWSPLAFRF